jgi:hypothetical protein
MTPLQTTETTLQLRRETLTRNLAERLHAWCECSTGEDLTAHLEATASKWEAENSAELRALNTTAASLVVRAMRLMAQW